MPELAEVHYYSRRWEPGLGSVVRKVGLHPKARVFRQCHPAMLRQLLTGSILSGIDTHGKQMLFTLSGGVWLSVHLGMSGELLARAPGGEASRHDHLILHMDGHDLVFRDPRMFGAIRAGSAPGHDRPAWWTALPPRPTDRSFTRAYFEQRLQRHARAPVKAFLLRQDCCPGVGNWMADEILWRSRIRPHRTVQSLGPDECRTLHRQTVAVCRDALRVIGRDWGTPPDTWLFNHRWSDGDSCPETGVDLIRETVAGRTTCWSPAWQR